SPAMGSEQLAAAPPLALAEIDLMIALDLVGHALGWPSLPATVRDTLFVFGAEKSAGTSALVDATPVPAGLVPRRAGSRLLPPLSDYEPFARRGVPFLFLTCGRWRHYHQPTDTPERLDYDKMVATATWLEALVRAAAGRPDPVCFLKGGEDDASTL